GVRASQLRDLFAEFRPAITSVLGPALERSAAIPKDLLQGSYPETAQQALNREVAAAIGFNFEAGRIDTTTHPFCTTLGPADCRPTTLYNPQHRTHSFFHILHQADLYLYDQFLPPD